MKRATGDRLSDTAKIGLLVAITSGKLHEHLLLYVSEASTYEQIRYRILNYVKSKRINQQFPEHSTSSGSVPMEVDAIGTQGTKK